MKVTTNLKKIDLIWFNISILPKMKSTYVGIIVLAILVFILIALNEGIPETPNEWIAISAGSIGGGVGGMLVGSLYSIISIIFVSTKKNGILGIHEYEITSEGLYEKTYANEGLSRWEGIKEIKVLNSYILFQISGYLFHVIPKNSFDSGKLFTEFVELSQSNWKSIHSKNSSNENT